LAGEADLKAQIVIEAKDEASKVFQQLSGSLGQLGGAFQSIATAAGPVGIGLGVLVAGLGAVVATGKSLADQVEQLDLLAARTGVASENLQVLNSQIATMGGNTEALTGALTFLNRSIATGDPLLAQLGVTSKDTLTAFHQLSAAFAASEDTAKKTEIGFRLMGRGAGELIALMPKLSSGFDGAKKSLTEMSGVLSGDVLEAARALDREADQLDSNWAAMMTSMKAATLPIAKDIIQAFGDMFDAMSGRKKSKAEIDTREMDRLRDFITATEKGIDSAKTRAGTEEWVSYWSKAVDTAKAKLELLRLTADQVNSDLSKSVDAPLLKDDLVDRAVLEPPKKVEKSAREELIERIMRTMERTRPVATALVKELEEISDLQFADSIREQLGFLSEIPIQNLAEVSEEVARMAELFQNSEEEAAGMVERLKELGDERERQRILNELEGPHRDTVQDIMVKWQEAVVEMQDLALVVDETFGQLFQGLEQGFNTAFQGILTGTQTVGEAIKSIWHSVVNAIIAELARLAAVAAFKAFLSFLNPGAGIASVLPGQGLGDLPLPNLQAPVPDFSMQNQPPDSFGMSQKPAPEPVNVTVAPTPEPTTVEPPPPMGNTFNVYTYDAHTIVADLVSPGGKLRRAQDTVAILGAY
jgi:hypothetical protein